MKKILLFNLIFLFVLFITGCSTKLEISGLDVVYIDEVISLTSNVNSEKAIWESSNENIAIVENGNVYGISEGEVIITLTIGKNSVSKVINVQYPIINISIQGPDVILINERRYLNAIIPEQYQDIYEGKWISSNPDIISIEENGKITGLSLGESTITYEYFGNVATKTISVQSKKVSDITINVKNVISIGEETEVFVDFFPSDSYDTYTIESSDESIIIVNNNTIKGLNIGKASIKVFLNSNKSIFSIVEIIVTGDKPDNITITGSNEVTEGEYIILNTIIEGNNISKDVYWESSDIKKAYVYNGIVLGLNAGVATIKVYSSLDKDIYDEILITIKANNKNEYTDDEINRVNNIISNMTLRQKVGQMFVVGFSGTSLSNSFKNVISEYNFGNIIYMGYNVTDINTLAKLSNDIQNQMVLSNTVPAFISTDQEGGRVARLVKGATHFVSNMAVGATNNFNYSKLIGEAMAKELLNYGINTDLAPVLDVNNNPLNPVIGVRSYYDNPLMVALYGKYMLEGMKSNNLMACPKHFPGHGNTTTDSHYGLPSINNSIDELYSTEFIPFITAVNNGLDCIMSAHMIFNAIDKNNPATLSEKVITGLLRNEWGYDGIVMTDAMEMNAISKYYGTYDKTAVMAVKAGCDLLLYTGNDNPRIALEGIITAVNNNEISEERINESVRRILLKKLRYNILDNYIANNENISDLLNKNRLLNLEIAQNSITLVKGEFKGLDKNKSTLIISLNCKYVVEYNSLGGYACNYLKENGYNNCESYIINTDITNSELQTLKSLINQYDQVILANSNINKIDNELNELIKLIKDKETNLIIALDSPFDILRYGYENVDNYICVYGYQEASIIALSKYLNNEFEAKGISPIDINSFK